jgi:hypothetical protein
MESALATKLRLEHLLLSVFTGCNLIVGYLFQRHPIIEDAAIHSELSGVILHNNLLPLTYEPVTNIHITYPPLFHYCVLLISAFTPIFTATKLLGIALYGALPISVYFAAKPFMRSPMIASFLSILIINPQYLIAYSAFPQILALNLLCFFLYFLGMRKRTAAGVTAGLIVLSHAFMGLFVAFVLAIYAILEKRKSIRTIGTAFAVSLPWLYNYALIIKHMLRNSWNNYSAHVLSTSSGFESLETLKEYFLYRYNIVLIVLCIFGFIQFMKSPAINRLDKTILGAIFVAPLIFTLYYYAPTQHKMSIILTLPVILFSSYYLSGDNHLKRIFAFPGHKRIRYTVYTAGILAFTCASLLLNILFSTAPVRRAHQWSAFDPALIPAAEWLGSQRADYSRMILIDESSITKHPRGFNSELVFSQIANKYPMDGTISDLEAYTRAYHQQLRDRIRIIHGDTELIRKYNIHYIVSKSCNENVIYSDRAVNICQVG